MAFQPPVNCLDLQCPPYRLTQDRYTLLDCLVDYVQTHDSTAFRGASKSKRIEYIYEDLAGCKAFTIIGQEDAISLTQHEHHRVQDNKLH